MRSCAICKHAIDSSLGIMCVLRLRAKIVTEPCEHWQREPGSDDDLQVWPASVAVRAGAMLQRADAPQATDIDGAVSDGAVQL